MENPQFLVYGPGGFYRPHRDNTRDPAAAEISRLRKVSVVLFLNSPSEEPGAGSYSGGSLVFYDLMRHADGRMPGLPLIPAEGLLVGFRSELLHGVTPVTSGQRYTLVTWYY
jgi:predicted 2-oxoglutarate/Fe(II)-dependent dioxygenase YbiX